MSLYSPETYVDNPVSVSGGTIDVANFPAVQPVNGTVSVGNFPATQPVSGSVSISNLPATQPVSGTVSIAGTVNVLTAVSSSATIAQVAMSNNTNNTILAANVNRKSAIIFVPSQPMNIAFSSTPASATNFTYRVTASSTTVTITGYTGQINGFGASNTLNVTELV